MKSARRLARVGYENDVDILMGRTEQEIHFCTTADGVRIGYATSGQGPPLVKAANWLNHLEFDWQSPIWRHVLEEFGSDHLMVRYDERGNGLSDWQVKDLSLEALVRDLESVVDALGLDRFPILGISQGGPVAIAYAALHPEKVSHLILYGSFASLGGLSPEQKKLGLTLLELIRLGWGQENPAFRQAWTSLYIPDGTAEQWQWFNELQRISTSPENAYRLFISIAQIDVTKLLPHVKAPTLVVHRRGDAVVPFELGRLLAASIPGARFAPLDGNNHLPLETEPAWPIFVTEVRRFLGAEREPLPKQAEHVIKATTAKGALSGRYEIISSIGKGGMAEVFLAQDKKLDRKIALKLLPGELATDKDRMRRFIQEAKAAAVLNHPNIAHIYEVGEDDGTHFIAMEFIDGRTLREEIHRERTELRKLLRYLQHTAQGLAKAHAAGIVHRDLKPDNIMITRDGHAKILDFGLAKLIEQHPLPTNDSSEAATAVMPQHSTPGAIMGTVGYMSPEQAQGKTKEIDHRSDIFSFGCILFEAVTGRKAFEGRDTVDSLNKIIREPVTPVSEINPSAPADLQRIVRRCLAKDPDERYQTIKDVAIELKDVRRELQGTEPHTTASPSAVNTIGSQSIHSSATLTPDSLSTRSSSAEHLVSQAKQHKLAIASVFILAVILIAGVSYGVYNLTGKNGTDISFESAKFTRVTSSGRATHASISPDGKYIVHVMRDAGKESLWVRQTLTGSNVQIVPPAEVVYWGITFSKDGNYVFYVTRDLGKGVGLLYRVPVLGGTPVTLTRDVDSAVTISPDSKQIAYLRWSPVEQISGLWIANVDGTSERRLAMRHDPEEFTGGPSWSPDGHIVACSMRGVESGTSFATVLGVRVSDGEQKQISSRRWDNVGQVAWFNDDGLIVNASEHNDIFRGQLWYISYSNGQARPITHDLNNYDDVSLSGDSSMVVTVLSDIQSNVFMVNAGDDEHPKQLTTGKGPDGVNVKWTPDGRILYDSQASGSNFDIWVMKADGSDQRAVTSDLNDDYMPSASADGRSIVFTSNRSGTSHIWRMNINGSNPIQLSNGKFGEGFNPAVLTPDGRWVLYSNQDGLWKTSIDGATPEKLVDQTALVKSVAPDGQSILYLSNTNQPEFRWLLEIMNIAGGSPVKTFELPPTANTIILQFSADGRSILYIDTRNGVSNIWSQPLDGSQPKQITNFKANQIFSFAYSRDGKQLAFARGETTSDVVMISGFKR